jgi:hypothetical protein
VFANDTLTAGAKPLMQVTTIGWIANTVRDKQYGRERRERGGEKAREAEKGERGGRGKGREGGEKLTYYKTDARSVLRSMANSRRLSVPLLVIIHRTVWLTLVLIKLKG